jgi:hypothetical protein
MTNTQKQKLRMYVALLAFLKSNPDVLAKLPNANEYIAQLEAIIASIQADDLLQKQDISEKTRKKNQLQKDLIGAIVDISEKIQAYASFVKNDELLRAVKYTESDLKRLLDIELLQTAKKLSLSVDENLSALTPYALTAETQVVYNKQITSFADYLPDLHQQRMDRKDSTERLIKEFATADEVIDNIDLLTKIVSKTEPKFYSNYLTTRKVDYAYGTVEFVGYVLDAQTGNGIPNALVTVTPKEEGDEPIAKNTAAKGGFQIKTIGMGIYTVTVTKLGYATQTIEIIITGDKPYNLTVKLVKS